MRPLDITNTGNSVLCSAIPLHAEPIVAPGIDATQRGFLRGRSMLANVVDIDEAMAHAALEEDDAAAVFFDFEAAFPSVDHGYILEVLRSRGWPPWFITIVELLYARNFCSITVCGTTGEGFELTAGVRQGCPLSPPVLHRH